MLCEKVQYILSKIIETTGNLNNLDWQQFLDTRAYESLLYLVSADETYDSVGTNFC